MANVERRIILQHISFYVLKKFFLVIIIIIITIMTQLVLSKQRATHLLSIYFVLFDTSVES